ncbi:hypothetical protein ACFVX9_37285 [Kitasatospora sp. NPDC058243]|uniref:hypothetical protein n=1 Tax=Kitasatospora sp. NPDC058243 TaxID=3346397 RepID=UPI0036D7E89B
MDSESAVRLGWTLGVSAPAPAAGLGIADVQAERALRHALATGAAAVRHREAVGPSVHALVVPEDAGGLDRRPARHRAAGLGAGRRAPRPGPPRW